MPANVNAIHVIKQPLLSEKSTYGMNEHKLYAFLVDPRATKTEIKDAIQTIYKVRVDSVNTQVRKNKTKRLKYGAVTPASTKKAIIKLHPEDSIELFQLGCSKKEHVMPIRIYKKTSAGRRNASVNEHVEVTKSSPEKSLLAPLPKSGGRNHSGKITSRGIGGGVKKMLRLIDFKRKDRDGVEGKVTGIEYDPNRSCHIALITYSDGVKRYIVSPLGLKAGQTVVSSSTGPVEPTPGNAMLLKYVPTGLDVHCVELEPGRGAQMCRSAGTYAKMSNREGDYATLVLPSGEVRRVPLECRCTIGQVGNSDHRLRQLGKAGLTRLMGRRPITRGVAKSHHAHPLGGGSGRSKGNRPLCGPTGVHSKGGNTRNRKKHSTKLIIRRRVSRRYGQKK